MESWQISTKQTIELIKDKENLLDGYAKVRITRAGICDTDLLLYNTNLNCPIIPCRHAIGVISEIDENNESGLKKGDNVVLDPYLTCGQCYFCKTEDFKHCQNIKVFGFNGNGFLRDFAVVPIDSIKLLPENVKTEDAIFLEYIATALKVLDCIDLHKGEHVVISGADILGNILAQLVIYYQAIPIMIDDNENNLEIAKNSDIYYTFKVDKDIDKNIYDITGGRLAKHAVYIANSNINIKNILNNVCNGAVIAITGLCEMQNNLKTISLTQALQKQLDIKFINNGYGNIDSAINILSKKVIDLSNVVKEVVKFNQVKKTFEKYKNEDYNSIFEIVVDCIND